MPVQRAEDVLNAYAADYLSKVVPEDRTCTFSVAQITYQYEGCEEHGEPPHSVVVWQIVVYIDAPEGATPIRYTTVVPYDALEDGDTDYLHQVLDNLWREVTFAMMMDTVEPALEAVAQEPEE